MLHALSGVVNASEPGPGLLTSGQPGLRNFEALKAAGLAAVIDIRDPMEPRPFDEAELLGRLGLEYHVVPIVQGALDDAAMDSFLSELRRHAHHPTLVHCASANRVGGALIPWFILDQGMSEDDAITAAMKVGLRGADLLEWGLDYTRRKTGG
jgi:protein tyrosine phosphatase (PTP) superfamily phosphohydrolase (DUF442 family)